MLNFRQFWWVLPVFMVFWILRTFLMVSAEIHWGTRCFAASPPDVGLQGPRHTRRSHHANTTPNATKWSTPNWKSVTVHHPSWWPDHPDHGTCFKRHAHNNWHLYWTEDARTQSHEFQCIEVDLYASPSCDKLNSRAFVWDVEPAQTFLCVFLYVSREIT